MKHYIIIALMSLVVLSCTHDPNEYKISESGDIELETRGNQKISVCHDGMILRVSVNAVPAHQGHGDAVDMDDDGYFDKKNGCGPTDCDDTNPALTDNCVVCDFMSILDMWDFDETCFDISTGAYLEGDYACIYDDSWSYETGACGTYQGGFLHSAAIFDNDISGVNTCQDDNENDFGFIWAYAQDYIYCGEHFIRGGYQYKLFDPSTQPWSVIIECVDEGFGQAYFDLGMQYIGVITDLQTSMGIPIPAVKCPKAYPDSSAPGSNYVTLDPEGMVNPSEFFDFSVAKIQSQ